MSKHKIEFTLPANLEFSSLVRRFSEEIFSHIGFVQEWSDRLKLVVDELFMNAVRYGSQADEGRIYVVFEFDEVAVNFRVEDEGGGSKKISAQELRDLVQRNSSEMADKTKTNGRGLALISNLWTDELQVEESHYGGVAISCKKIISNDTPPAPPPADSGLEASSPVVARGAKMEVEIEGDIDVTNLEAKIKPIREKLNALSPGGTFVIDCQNLSYINSIFIGHLSTWINQLRSKGGRLVLKNTNRQIKDALGIVGLSDVIYIES